MTSRQKLIQPVMALAVLAFMAIFVPANAQDNWPSKPVKVIVPSSPGGGTDIFGRLLAQALTDELRQPFVVDNRASASGNIGAAATAKSAPDGYTFMVTDGSTFSINPLISKSLSYDYKRDFVAVSLAARAPLYLAVHPKTPANNLRELIALAKAKPGTLTYGSSGIGSTHHLTMESLKASLGMEITHIPFKGTGQSVPALVGGQVDMLFSALPSLIGFVKSGQVRLLATASASSSGACIALAISARAGVTRGRCSSGSSSSSSCNENR
jgi:tripartite-type tricarboxylate transporter receptor subunit TctC